MSNSPFSYQQKEQFKTAVREGDSASAIALVERMRAESVDDSIPFILTSPGTWDGDRTPLMMALDPQMHPGLPVDLELVRALLDAGSPVNADRYAGQPNRPRPLLFAVLSGSLPAVELLLERGANAGDEHGSWIWTSGDIKSLLVRAIEAGQSAIAVRLLEAGADPHGQPPWPRPLQAAARMGDVVVTQALLARGVDVNAQFPDAVKPSTNGASYQPSTTALMEATRENHSAVIQLLLAHGANVNARIDTGFTALHAACAYAARHPTIGLETVRKLLEVGADPNATPNDSDPWGLAPLSTLLFNRVPHAVLLEDQKDFLAVVELLLQSGANPNTLSFRGSRLIPVSPLEQALDKRDARTILLLIRAGADISTVDGTQLWLLANGDEGEANRELAAMLGARGLAPDVNAQNAALPGAIADGDFERVRILLDHGASPNSVSDRDGPPLHLAADYSHADIVRELLHRGANPNARFGNGATALHQAAISGERDLSSEEERKLFAQKRRPTDADSVHVNPDREWWLEQMANWLADRNLATVSAILEAGADVSATDDAGDSPLHLAVANASPAVVEALLKAGAPVEGHNHNNRTPLHELVARGRRRRLLKDKPYLRADAQIDISVVTEPSLLYRLRENHALLSRATNNDEAILRLLITYGANVNALGFNDFLPLHLASFYGTPEMVQLLLDAGAKTNGLVTGCNALQYMLTVGRTPNLFKAHSFEFEKFPGVREQLLTAALLPDFKPETLLQRGTPELQAAAREDVAIMRVLLKAGAEFEQAAA